MCLVKDVCLRLLKKPPCRVSRRQPLPRGSLTEGRGGDGGTGGRRIDVQDLHQPHDPLAPLLVGLQQPLVFMLNKFYTLNLRICFYVQLAKSA